MSYERVLSGDGLFNVYAFLRDTGSSPEPPWLAARLAQGDRNATIAELALEGARRAAPRRSTSSAPSSAPRRATLR